jgi:hypothetical protein
MDDVEHVSRPYLSVFVGVRYVYHKQRRFHDLEIQLGVLSPCEKKHNSANQRDSADDWG